MTKKMITDRVRKDLKYLYNIDVNILRKTFNIKKYIKNSDLLIILKEQIINRDKRILNYANDLLENFRIKQYNIYKQFKKNNLYDSSSLEFYKRKYGEELGIEKKLNTKRQNVYDPEYISKRDNISLEEAKIKIIKFKSDKATSLEGFKKRHGEKEGIKKFEKFKKTSVVSIENYQKKYNDLEKGKKRYGEYILKLKIKYPNCKEYYHNKGIHDDILIKYLISHHQKFNSGYHLEYWISKYGEKEGLKRWNNINVKKSVTLETYIHKYGKIEGNIKWEKLCKDKNVGLLKMIERYGKEEGLIKHNNRIDKMVSTFVKQGKAVPLHKLNDFNKYKKIVNRLTNISLILYGKTKLGDNWKDKIGIKKMHIDHKYSQYNGFMNNVEPYIIGNINNLELLYYKDNISKNKNNSITIELLNEQINNCKYENN